MIGKKIGVTSKVVMDMLKVNQPDFGQLLSYARALREQIHWDEVRARSEASPFARAFFTLVEGLGIVEPALLEEERRPR